ncbi:MAG TPA: hypothetical protein GX700_06340 [Paracoccus sp.]|nr:hypothetical protein [Paracoccus sp. (in: a-proteobacteria)]
MRSIALRAAALTAAAWAFAAPALAQDMMFTLNNRTGYVLVEFYASPVTSSDWEEDILGADVLGSGESVDVLIADGRANCEYDFLMVFDDGDEVTDQVNICELGSYTLE